MMASRRNYPLLLASQFLGAFGDNVILAVIIGQLTFMHRDGLLSDDKLRIYNALVTTILFVPYILLAPIAGYLNDRFAKTGWLFGGNLIKLLGTALAAMSVWWGNAWQPIGYFVVGIGSCVYSPAKYGILPEILPRERLVKANGTVELLTLLAILAGPVTGATMVDKLAVSWCYAVLLGIFGLSLLLNSFMDRTPSHPEILLAPSARAFFENFHALILDARLIKILLGTGVFWVCGAVMKMNFQPWGLNVLHLPNNTRIAELGLWLGIGIMGGSVLSGQLHRVGDLRKTRLYGILLAGFILLLSLIAQRLLIPPTLIMIGACAGLFLIPLNAALQAESHPDKLGKTIATQNFIDNIGMVLGGVGVVAATRVHLNTQGVFAALAVFVLAAVWFLKFPELKQKASHA